MIPASLDTYLCCGARVLGVVALLPIGWDLLGLSQRMTLAGALTLFLVGNLPASVQPELWDLPVGFLVGLVIVLPLAIAIECASNVGELFDTLRGQTLGTAYDPLQQQTVPVSAALSKFAAWALILGSGSALELVAGLAESFLVVPVDGISAGGSARAGYGVLFHLSGMLSASFVACLPFAIACIGCEVGIAFTARQLPGASLQTEGVLLKLMVSLLMIVAALGGGALDPLPSFARPVLQLLNFGR